MGVHEVRAAVALAQGRSDVALHHAQSAYRLHLTPDATSPQTAMRAAAWLGDAPAVSDALRVISDQPGRAWAAVRREGTAALAALEGRGDEATAGFLDAAHRWQSLGLSFEAALCSLSLVTMLGAAASDGRASAEQAGALFERLGARPLASLLATAMHAPQPADLSREVAATAEDSARR
jgi:hypothetical protein